MGFWHTGYLEFHEPDDSGVYSAARIEPVRYRCELCSTEFEAVESLHRHRFEEHPVQRPTLLVRGSEVGNTPLQITSPLRSSDVQLGRCDRANLNGTETSIDAVPDRLAATGFGTVRLELSNGGISSTFELRFAIATEADLSGVEKSFADIARRRRLEMRDIEAFIEGARPYETAERYVDGICDYLYGVLAKERHPDSSILPGQYVERYRAASDALKYYQRPLAATVVALVAFHFNHFPEIGELGVGGRVELASRRLNCWLEGNNPGIWPTEEAATASHLEQLLTEVHAERILRWSVLSTGELRLELPVMEDFLLTDLAGCDAAKLRVLLAECYIADGRVADSCRHASELVHDSDLGKWAGTIVSHGRRLEDSND